MLSGAEGECKACPAGQYRNETVARLFPDDICSICPGASDTPGVASTLSTDCRRERMSGKRLTPVLAPAPYTGLALRPADANLLFASRRCKALYHFITSADGTETCELCKTDGSTTCVDGYLVPSAGFWHSSPGSSDVQQCPFLQACIFANRTGQLLEITSEVAGGVAPSLTDGGNSTASAAALRRGRWLLQVPSPAVPPPPGAPAGPPAGTPSSRTPPVPAAPPQPPGGFAGFGLPPAFNSSLMDLLAEEDLERYRDSQCAEGFRGPLCTLCADGYGRLRALECSKCPERWKNNGYYAAIFIGNMLSLLFTVRATILQNTGAARPPLYGQILKMCVSSAVLSLEPPLCSPHSIIALHHD